MELMSLIQFGSASQGTSQWKKGERDPCCCLERAKPCCISLEPIGRARRWSWFRVANHVGKHSADHGDRLGRLGGNVWGVSCKRWFRYRYLHHRRARPSRYTSGRLPSVGSSGPWRVLFVPRTPPPPHRKLYSAAGPTGSPGRCPSSQGWRRLAATDCPLAHRVNSRRTSCWGIRIPEYARRQLSKGLTNIHVVSSPVRPSGHTPGAGGLNHTS